MSDEFREQVIRELAEVIAEHGCDRTAVHALRVAEAIADRLTCPDCEFIDIGLGNIGNRCATCAPRYRAQLAAAENPTDVITITYRRDDGWTRRIRIGAGGKLEFPDGVPSVATPQPNPMTTEHAISAFYANGYRLDSTVGKVS